MRIASTYAEGIQNPLGLDQPKPRLSWALEASERGEQQAAYQIEARTKNGVIWDSGRVTSSQSMHVAWGGPRLESRQRVVWSVRVWDGNESVSDWSAPAHFELGLLESLDWRAEWIGAMPRPTPRDLVPRLDRETKWISASGEMKQSGGEAVFCLGFEIPAGRTVTAFLGAFAANGRFQVSVDEQTLGGGDGRETATPIVVRPLELGQGAHSLRVNVETVHEAPELAGHAVIILDNSETLEIRTNSTWPDCKEVGTCGDRARGHAPLLVSSAPAPLLRKEFAIDKEIASARAYVTGVGYYELYINGKKIGDHVLDPGFTRYDRRTLYVTYEIENALIQGKNAVGILLGNGFYTPLGRDEWNLEQAPWCSSPRALVQLVATYTDGTEALIVSDETWKTAPSPIVFNGVRHGETYDARLERPRWAEADEDATDWVPVCKVAGPGGVLSPQLMAPIKVTETLTPRSVKEITPGVFLFDLGQNIAGWARLRVRGPRGQKIVIRYGERLTETGGLDQHHIAQYTLDGPFQTDSYILRGEGEECWEPRFTYHGFQYIEVSGWPGTPTLESLDGRVVHTAFEQIGDFSCSNPLLNQLQQATLWSYRGNFHSIPTDCPHREKNGWTGDAQLAVDQAMFNWGNLEGYRKWTQDIVDEQRASGALPGIVPNGGWGYRWGNGPAYDSALLLIPWAVYLHTGDLRILEDSYVAFKRYVDYMGTRDYMAENPSGWLGDWLQLTAKTLPAVTHAGYHAVDARIVANTARLLGRDDDAARYDAVANDVAKRFCVAFLDAETGKVSNGTQTAQSTALYQGLVQGAARLKVTEQLLQAVKDNDGVLNVGTLGTKSLPWALTAAGRADLFYAMLTSRAFPGWSHWIEQGATTLWENWAGDASRNHIFLGDISAWFYAALAGINPDESAPGYERVVFRPEVLPDLDWVSAEVRTLRGLVASKWKRGRSVLTMEVSVPVGSTALVYVPALEREQINADGGEFVDSAGGRQVFRVGSGKYQFVVR